MKYSQVFILLIVSVLSCKQETKHSDNHNEAADTAAVINNSLHIKSKIDSLIKQKKTLGGISCGEKFSHEIDLDSSGIKIKSTIFYYPTSGLSEATITSYFSYGEMIFANIKFRTDLRESPKFEQNIYFDGITQIKQQIIGEKHELPESVQEVIKKTL